MVRSALAAIIFFGVTASAQGAEPSIAHGEELAKANCSQCHAVGQTGESAHQKAPPFRMLSERLPVDTIAEMLLAKLSPEHSDMPKFTATPEQAADLEAFITSIQPIEHGRRLVEENCSRCHAIGKEGDSPHTAAPPFRTLSERYPIDALEEAFAEGIETGHPDMPVFTAEPYQIADILAYIWSIQPEEKD
ncbi:MAG: cytochrome c [Rhizobiaceae bacterium]